MITDNDRVCTDEESPMFISPSPPQMSDASRTAVAAETRNYLERIELVLHSNKGRVPHNSSSQRGFLYTQAPQAKRTVLKNLQDYIHTRGL